MCIIYIIYINNLYTFEEIQLNGRKLDEHHR